MKNQAMRSKELSIELRDKNVLRSRSGEGNQSISAALKVPKNTVASIILKWKKFGTTKTPRAGRPAKLSNRGRRALVREVTKNPMFTLTEFLYGDARTFQKVNHLSQSGLYGRVARQKPLLSKSNMTACLEFAKRHLKDSDHEKQDYLVWLIKDWTLWPECQVSRLEETQHHPYGEAWWWQHRTVGMFFRDRDWETCQDQGKDERSTVQRDSWWKPAPEHPGPPTGAKVHLPTRQRT